MDKEAKKENTSLLLNCNNTNNHNHNNNDIDDSPKKPLIGHSGGGCGLLIGGSGSGNVGGDRLKRDEWSEGAVSCLLEAYESKWILRNRAKLKGHDWEDVAKYVSSRASCTKSPKTQTQCKNKIESMKKRYRSESAAPDASSWPLFPRLDLLLRGSAPPPLLPLPPPPHPPALPPPTMLIEPLSQSPPAAPPLRPPPPPPPPIAAPLTPALAPTPTPAPVAIHLGVAQNSHGSNGVDRVTKGDHGMDAKMSDDHASDKTATDETDSSTPEALYSDKEKLKSSKNEHDHQKTNYKKKRPRRSREDWPEVAESIRWLAEVVVRSEQARVDTMRELEKMRAEAEAKRGEIDLKRTEIIANTQLEIARLFAGIGGKGGVDPSLRIGRS